MLVINGWSSSLAAAMRALVSVEEPDEQFIQSGEASDEIAAGSERFLFCQGFLPGKALKDYTANDEAAVFKINFSDVAQRVDWVIRNNRRARICIITSESGFSGSYDEGYAAAKAAMIEFIVNKKLQAPGQQLVGIAPTIIRDAGMTLKRPDLADVDRRGEAHPKGRWLMAAEVARLAHFLLYEDLGYISGTVIRMHGGAPHT